MDAYTFAPHHAASHHIRANVIVAQVHNERKCALLARQSLHAKVAIHMSCNAEADLHDCLCLGSSVGMADVHHMKQQTSFRDLFKRRSEGSYQLRGQFLYKPYCIGQ